MPAAPNGTGARGRAARRPLWRKWALAGAGGLVLAAAGLYGLLAASLPQLEGARRLPGLSRPGTIGRDSHGFPTISGGSRTDVARMLGFVHAQERFFQMDLLRRRAAGELAALMGPTAVPLDRTVVLHRFRELSRAVVARAPREQRALIEAYAEGVNAGLAALRVRPFEYFLLRSRPEPWRPEDCALVLYSMLLDLQAPDERYKLALARVCDELGPEALAFFSPLCGPDDAALDGSRSPLPALPAAAALELRRPGNGGTAPAASAFGGSPLAEEYPGSNALAIAGAAGGGAALLANDVHLALAVPNIWYRASLEWPRAAAGTGGVRVTGVTLPGLPLVVIGSNGSVAWGLTNSYCDTGDLVLIGEEAAGSRSGRILVKGAAPISIEARWSDWGPVVGTDRSGRWLAYHWSGDDPAALNFELVGLETAADAAAAAAVAARSGVPVTNFLCADSQGSIAWTLAGRVPRRRGFEGRLPVAFGPECRWDGFLEGDEVPLVLIPGARGESGPEAPAWGTAGRGRLWAANSRLIGGAPLRRLGDGGYANPARAAQLRNDLDQLLAGTAEGVHPADLLAVQLDDRAPYLDRWHRLLLALLSSKEAAGDRALAGLRPVAQKWDGRADAGSVGYKVVRDFRQAVARRVLNPLFDPCVRADPRFSWSHLNFEAGLWCLVETKPARLLGPSYASWNGLLLAAAADVAAAARSAEGAPLDAAWGKWNTLDMRHPLADALPWGLGRLLAMPAEPLSGDANMPRVQAPSFGASLRLVVAPGREEEGILETPGGQSSHPLSSYFRADHSAWVQGLPAPFLPGTEIHRLRFQPGG